ncbi:hypothetical protein C1646_816953 [Rhizophagus diaphanus]|nr:hypothetical protein C1646_816953 [Rhizophagus diaphanus] [Rhizophagus sp. MUCL 43196]
MVMIMWELTTGCKPFTNVEHDIQLIYKILDGERPVITNDTPECYANLMEKNKHIETFNQAESKRREPINSGKLGPEFSGKPHPNAIFTSRPLSSLISKCSSINSSKELELDIDFERSNVLGIKRNIEELKYKYS